MAIGEHQTRTGESNETADVDTDVGWRYTIAKIYNDTTARFGLYTVVLVLLVALLTGIEAHLSTLTMGRVNDFALVERIWHHPEQLPEPGEAERRKPPVYDADGSWTHPLGTDQQGRDYLVRLIYGAQISVFVGIIATGLGMIGGIIVGAVAGYYGGWVDDLLMRIVEVLYSIPPLVLVIVFTVFVTQNNPNITYAAIGVGISFVPVFARLIRSRVLSVREMDYIEAARAAGVKDHNILRRHIIPNSFAPVVVLATLQIGVTILIVAGLSYLGYGAQPPTPDWGQMLYSAHTYINTDPWMSIPPGVAIMITIFGFNLFGDGLQDALDPRIR